MNTNLQALEPQARVLAATAVSQSLSFCMERKYLTDISVSENEAFELEAIPTTLESSASWIEIQQIGKPLDKSAEACFTAMQKILYSCFLPKEMQLLFYPEVHILQVHICDISHPVCLQEVQDLQHLKVLCSYPT